LLAFRMPGILKTYKYVRFETVVKTIITKNGILNFINYMSVASMLFKIKSIIIFLLIFMYSLSVQAQCNLKTTNDPCDDLVTRSAYYENVSSIPGNLKVKIEQNITYRDTSMALFILLKPGYKSCFGKESKISLKSGNDFITLPLSGQIICRNEGEKLIDYSKMTKESIDFLKRHAINKIRVYYNNSYDDFVIDKQDYFIRTLQCFQ